MANIDMANIAYSSAKCIAFIYCLHLTVDFIACSHSHGGLRNEVENYCLWLDAMCIVGKMLVPF